MQRDGDAGSRPETTGGPLVRLLLDETAARRGFDAMDLALKNRAGAQAA
ncbi:MULTISPECIES: hypothetical protein [Natrialbaceae]|nr:hypothetical protein [Natronococcus sp. CG52]